MINDAWTTNPNPSATSTIDEETLYNLCQYGLLRYDSDDEEYGYDEYDTDDDDALLDSTITSTSGGMATTGRDHHQRHHHLNFTEYDSEDDEIPLKHSKAERDRRRRNRKQIRRIAQRKHCTTDSGVLMIDRYNEDEFEGLLQALLLHKQQQQQSLSSSTQRPSSMSDSAEHHYSSCNSVLATIRVRRNSRQRTRTRTIQQIKELFVIISTCIPSLEHLDVTGFDATDDEIEIVSQSLCKHPTLQKLDIDTLNFDVKLLRALQTIPNLHYIGLDMRDSTPLAPLLLASSTSLLSNTSHTTVLTHPCYRTLKHLKLSSYNYFFSYNNEDAALDMINSLKTNTTLETLDIKLICDSMVTCIIDMLQYNTSLRSLTFAGLLDGDETKADNFFKSLCNMFALKKKKEQNHDNTTTPSSKLKSLIIQNELNVGYDGQYAILDMLCHHNDTLEQLQFDWCPTSSTKQAMTKHRREDFELSKNFFLKHNQLKTKRLMLGNNNSICTPNYWVTTILSEHINHVQSIYYLLQMNPCTFFGNGSGGCGGGNNFVGNSSSYSSSSCSSSLTRDNNKHLRNQDICTATTKVSDSNTSISMNDEDSDDDESWWMILD